MAYESVSDFIKAVVEAVIGEIPVGGSVVVIITEALWPPNDQPDVWETIKDQAEKMVDARILAFELDERRHEMDGLKDTMKQYKRAKIHERGNLLDILLDRANTLRHALLESENAIHLIPLAVVLAHMHLTFLWERLKHGTDMYDEDNSDIWLDELTENYNTYRTYFREIYPKWKIWRDAQIEAKWYTTTTPVLTSVAHGEVIDHLTENTLHNSIHYERVLDSVAETFKGVCMAIQEQRQNQATAEMAGILASTFFLHIYLPGREKDPADVDPALATIWLGPYGPATLGLSDSGPYTTDTDDKPGALSQIYVREWNSIDGLQFIYTDHVGHFIGNPQGGVPHNINVDRKKYCTGLKMRFANGVLCRVQAAFSDGTNSEVLGNRGNWPGADVDATIGSNYKLVGGSFRQGRGPSGTVGTGVIKLQFQPA